MKAPTLLALTDAQVAWLADGPAIARRLLDAMAVYGRRYSEDGTKLSDGEIVDLRLDAERLHQLAVEAGP